MSKCGPCCFIAILHTGIIPWAKVENGASFEAEQSNENMIPPSNIKLGNVWLQSG